MGCVDRAAASQPLSSSLIGSLTCSRSVAGLYPVIKYLLYMKLGMALVAFVAGRSSIALIMLFILFNKVILTVRSFVGWLVGWLVG